MPYLQVLRYICQHNPWYKVPGRLLLALLYQCYKRLTKGIVTLTLFNGKKIFLFPANPICSAFVYTAIPDYAEIQALRKLADNETVFIDVGANVGSYSLLLLDKVKAVHAFEAHPETAQYCKLNFLLNGIDESQVHCQAISHNEEPKYFSNAMAACPTNRVVTNSTDAIKVPATTLDLFVQQQQFEPNTNFLLKIDVEGFEYEVFQGAKQFLSQFPVRGIIFEGFSAKNQAILDLLQQFGFQTHYISENNLFAYPERNQT